MSMKELATCFPTTDRLTSSNAATIVPFDEDREEGCAGYLATSPSLLVLSAARVFVRSSAAMKGNPERVSPLSRQGDCIG
jgi:hypothetical protein